MVTDTRISFLDSMSPDKFESLTHGVYDGFETHIIIAIRAKGHIVEGTWIKINCPKEEVLAALKELVGRIDLIEDIIND